MDLLASLSAALPDRYRIERELGSGGMATVCLAEDVKHDRKVAVKVLRPELAAVLGAERFLNEIRVTANLQHSHILPLFDSGEAGGFLYYVMPYVAGESLQDKLRRERQLPVDTAVRIAKEVAAALDYAHRRGVVHRDIKPGNILLHEGQALVADFGIALAIRVAGGDRVTETGLSLGTPEYMSPEQAAGDREIDGRSDLYSLGAVLYEMLSGDPPHTGSTVQAIVAKVLTDRPRPVRELRDTVPVHVEAALVKTLAKLPADRFESAAQLIEALERPGAGVAEAATEGERVEAAFPRRQVSSRWQRVAWPLATAAAVAIAVWSVTRPAPAPQLPSRWTIELPQEHQLAVSLWDRPLAVSPDGAYLAYVTESRGVRQLWLRWRNAFEARPVAESEGATNPFFSPDGRWIAFAAQSRLYKVPVSGGRPIPICELGGVGLGGSWGENDTIVVAQIDQGLRRVSAMGGVPDDLQFEAEGPTVADERWFWIGWPQVLRGGDALLATAATPNGFRVAAASLRPLARAGVLSTLGEAMGPQYLPTGDLIYSQAGVLYAVPFDVETLETRGAPVPLLDDIATTPGGSAAYLAVSATGVLAYATSSVTDAQLVWVDRDGNATPVAAHRADYHGPRLSPDGRRLVVTEVHEGRFSLWLYDVERGTHTRLTSGLQVNDAVWTPDGRRVAFAGMIDTLTQDMQDMAVAWTAADSTGDVEILTRSEGANAFPHSWSPDMAALAFYFISPETARDIWILPRGGEAQPFLVTPYNERTPTFSPDGRWIAYTSDESGRDEVYVTAFPGPRDTRMVSRDGGRTAVWSRDGRELFYRNGDRMMSVPVELQPSFAAGDPRVLFQGNFYAEPSGSGTQDYDVSPDGQRFVMIQTEAPTRIHVILNWFEELREAKGR